MVMPVKALDAIRYGRLTPLFHKSGGWLCRCDCGAECTVTGNHLRQGRVQSCGCLNTEKLRAPKTHGKSKTRTWTIWNLMRQRCTNPRNESFKNYGGRGITICQRWDEFANFLADMGEAPTGLTIDRCENDGNYEPGNCRWVTRGEQALNTRRNRIISLNGRSQPLVVWCRELGLPYWTVHARLRRGATAQEALQL